ncbi:MAG: TRAP transporter large permease subunit [Desulfobacterota bacterium]|nr:TRAP transporter large permease subunit [Thermodesulfobacteriota bacterium]
MKKEAWFGLSIMAVVVFIVFMIMPPPSEMTTGHLGLLMLAMIVVAIMLGFPTAFTLMGMGTMFAYFAYRSVNPETAVRQTLDLMVARAYAVMNNDVLIAIPLFVFMGYLVQRSNLIEMLFKGLHLATARIPGSLAVATIATCAVFATATGIIGAAVTLMGLLAFPAMLKAGYGIKLSAGAVTAGGTLGILIPPSVLLILYGATAGVSVVQLYAGAFFPGFMLASLYIAYVIVLAKLRPDVAPPLPEEERRVELPSYEKSIIENLKTRNVMKGFVKALLKNRVVKIPPRTLIGQLGIGLLPVFAAVLLLGGIYLTLTAPEAVVVGVQEMGLASRIEGEAAPETETSLKVEELTGLQEPPSEEAAEGEKPSGAVEEAPQPQTEAEAPQEAPPSQVATGERKPAPRGFWIAVGIVAAGFVLFYSIFNFVRFEIFKILLKSFFPLAILVLGVLGTIILGLATPGEAAAMGSFGGIVLAAAYRQLNFKMLKESVFLTAKTSAMVCWLFVGSSMFAAAFALLGGQEIINDWVKSLDLTAIQFMILAQVIIFLLGWPLEWTEIIVIFMPIFIPLLSHFQIDPLFFGLLVALNLQTAFLSPPVAMAAFYLKGVAPPHVTLNQIFLGMMPFMGIQVIAIIILYIFPQIGLWLPSLVYK